MIYNCLIVDDEPVAREIIQNYCNHLSFLKVIKCCGNALEARSILLQQEINILFLDINMPVLDGIAFLKTLTQSPQVIFTTAYKEYAINAFDLSACDYLVKPFSLERFIVAVDKAAGRINNSKNLQENTLEKGDGFFFIKVNGKIIRIRHDDFIFAEARGNYIKIVCSTDTVLASMTFANFEKLLPKNIFTRVHRSFIINKSKISQIEGNTIFIGKVEIPIGNNYKEGLMKNLGL